jgi:hypothetical protein
MSDEHDVGYTRPPKQTQFKPGHSGNPKGRPKHARSFMTELLDELNEEIPVSEGNRTITVSKQKAIVKILVGAALGGDVRTAVLLASLSIRKGNHRADDEETDPAADDRDIVEAFLSRELKRKKSISKQS